MDKIHNEDMKKELKIFNLNNKISQYQNEWRNHI